MRDLIHSSAFLAGKVLVLLGNFYILGPDFNMNSWVIQEAAEHCELIDGSFHQG